MKIFHLGLYENKTISPTLAEVILSNKFTLAIIGVVLAYVGVYSFLGQYFIASGMFIGFWFLIFGLYLVHRQQFILSRYMLLMVANLLIALADIAFQFEINAENYYLPSSLVAFLIFELSEKRHILFSLAGPPLLWFVPRILHLHFPAEVPPLSPTEFTVLRYYNYFGAFVVTNYFAYIFFQSLGDFQNRLVSSSKFTALGEMSASMAHEINNPLAIIIGKVIGLRRAIDQEKIDNTKLKSDLEKIESTAERIGKIVKGLKSFSRHGSGDPLVPVMLSEVIQDAVNLCLDKLNNDGIKIMLPPKSDLVIHCRQHEIVQVLLNLIGNSADAVRGSTEPWIKIELRDADRVLQLTVTDSGLGIPAPVVAKMMEPFFTTKEVGRGTGLGLSISKGILDAHGGRLFYDPKSKNTRFVLEFPKAVDAALAEKRPA